MFDFNVFIKFSDYSFPVKLIVVCWVVFTAAVAIAMVVAKPVNVTAEIKTPPQENVQSPLRTRPVFIKATNCEGLTMENNTVIGDADFAELENVANIKASGNIHTVPVNK